MRAFEYTGFDPLVKDSEGWRAAIARFNPSNADDDSDDSDDSEYESVPDPYSQQEKDDLRKEVCIITTLFVSIFPISQPHPS